MTAVSSVNYQTAVMASNVSTIEQAKIVGLLAVHSNHKDYAKQCAFVEAVLKAHCTAQDVIVVEDSSQKPKNALLTKQMPNLNPDDYNITGWDDPEVCAQFIVFHALRQKIRLAMQQGHMGTMVEFLIKHPLITPYPLDMTNNKMVTMACDLQLTRMETAFTKKTLSQRQRSLIQRSAQLPIDFAGKLFFLMGPLHATREWIEALKVNYIIIQSG